MPKVLDRLTINTLSYEERVQYFLERAKEVHGDKYSYENMNYVRNKEKIDITCAMHGIFKQTPHDHVRGRGCPYCGGKKQGSTEDFITKAVALYGDKYDYSKTLYQRVQDKVEIGCRLHGSFFQRPDMHLLVEGCKICNNQTKDRDHFISRARRVHGDLYDYTNTVYVNTTTKISITCRQHGDFIQSIKHHYEGKGCPVCVHRTSKPELEVISLIMDLLPNEQISTSVSPEWMQGQREIDIYVPSKRFAIEYNGDYWHSEKFGRDKEWHQRKHDEAMAAGITQLHIWDSRWNSEYKLVYLNIINNLISGNHDKIAHLIMDNIWLNHS